MNEKLYYFTCFRKFEVSSMDSPVPKAAKVWRLIFCWGIASVLVTLTIIGMNVPQESGWRGLGLFMLPATFFVLLPILPSSPGFCDGGNWPDH